jgi:hypothetical protein
MKAIESCRTASLGGEVYLCNICRKYRYSFHSCKNRHCPKCQNDQAGEWLEKQRNLLLPVTYFMVTFTLPHELRAVARSHQKIVYTILFRASSQALKKLARDPRFLGAQIGMVAVLHTWTRDLQYHPHVHFIVAGGGLTDDGRWVCSRKDFLVHVKPLAIIFRAKVRDLLNKAGLFHQVDNRVWQKPWVVHSEPVGTGIPAFKYLAPYIFRVAITNKRILSLKDGLVTFQYKESATDQLKTSRLPAQEFIRRFLQHVLPKGFVKVRYYGLLSPSNRLLLEKARQLLPARPSQIIPHPFQLCEPEPEGPLCPECGSKLLFLGRFTPINREPPRPLSEDNDVIASQHTSSRLCASRANIIAAPGSISARSSCLTPENQVSYTRQAPGVVKASPCEWVVDSTVRTRSSPRQARPTVESTDRAINWTQGRIVDATTPSQGELPVELKLQTKASL